MGIKMNLNGDVIDLPRDSYRVVDLREEGRIPRGHYLVVREPTGRVRQLDDGEEVNPGGGDFATIPHYEFGRRAG